MAGPEAGAIIVLMRLRLARTLAVVLLCLATGCSNPGPPESVATLEEPNVRPPVDRLPDIIIISTDTLRPDHLGAHGYRRRTSPFLDAFAGRCAVFERAYSHASWTPPSVASLLTSTYPPQHGSLGRDRIVLAVANTTAAEIFAAAGYYTVAYSASPFIHPDYGFGQGFHRFGFVSDAPADKLIDMVASDLPAIRRDHPDRPLFVYVMLFDPHFPYVPPEADRDRFLADVPGFDPRRVIQLSSLFDVGAVVGRDTFENLRAGYDGEIAVADRGLARLIGLLDRGELGLDPGRSFLVLTSDHGEEFLEHSGFGHGSALYEESIRALLWVREPGRQAGTRITDPVRQVDLLPTLLESAGLSARPGLMGKSLAGMLRGEPDPGREIYASSLHLFHQGESQRCLIRNNLKLILVRNPDRAELYDLAADPGELVNLAESRMDEVRKLGERLEQLEGGFKPVGGGAPPPGRTLDLLRRLGYIQ